MVIPARSEFVQVINVGSHWVCLSTLGCHAGTVKLFDSLYNKPNSVVINHACHMLLHPGNGVTFINEKVQKQVGLSDCGLFALAFATDLCHGFDPTAQKYNQREFRHHYKSCLESGKMTPFPKTEKRVPYHLACNKVSIPIFCLGRLPNDIRQEYVECSAGTILSTPQYQNEQSILGSNGSAKLSKNRGKEEDTLKCQIRYIYCNKKITHNIT